MTSVAARPLIERVAAIARRLRRQPRLRRSTWTATLADVRRADAHRLAW